MTEPGLPRTTDTGGCPAMMEPGLRTTNNGRGPSMNRLILERSNHPTWRYLLIVVFIVIANCLHCDRTEPVHAGPDYRLRQCLTYRKLPLDGRTPAWVPFDDPVDPCSLRCHDARLRLSVLLESSVPNGTTCRNQTNSDGICVSGTCVSVGCDGQLGSRQVVDRCGVCGGDGSSCQPSALASSASASASSASASSASASSASVSSTFSALSGASNFEWHETNFSSCSVSCGVGVQTTEVICREKKRLLTIDDEQRCNYKTKPRERRRSCRIACPGQYVWTTGTWSDCTRSCGAGVEHRPTICAAQLTDGSFERVPEQLCSDDTKPDVTRVCNAAECPQWIAGQWSPCSKTCSIGIQQRVVVCRRPSMYNCSTDDQPITEKPCHSGISCSKGRGEMGWETVVGEEVGGVGGGEAAASHHPSRLMELRGRPDYQLSDLRRSHLDLTDRWEEEEDENEEDEEEEEENVRTINRGSKTTQNKHSSYKRSRVRASGQNRRKSTPHHRSFLRHPTRAPPRTKVPPKGTTKAPPKTTKALPKTSRAPPKTRTIQFAAPTSVSSSVHLDQDPMIGSGDTDRPMDYEHPGERRELNAGPVGDNREVSTIPSFVVSSWGLCSAVCGTGIRTRRVQCQVFHEVSRTVHDLPDSSCSGQKPVDSEYCSMSDCHEQARQESYSYILTGHGPCSRSCAGGTQDASFSCLRISDRVIVKNDKCNHIQKPYKPPQSCNEHRCPPRWRAFPHGPCSATCGGGHQLRVIRCIYDLPNGDLEEVPDDRCSPPKPPRALLCNMAPCAPVWNVDSWSKCSVTCGSGQQTRTVRCEQKISLANVATVNETFCAEYSVRPPAKQMCDMGECPNATVKQSPIIYGEVSSFVQLKSPPSKVILIVGGTAVLIPGTTVQVFCPVRGFNKSQIAWYHGEREIARKGRVKVSPKGILRIRSSRETDAGVFTCMAGRDSANMTLSFHSLLTAHNLQRTKLPYMERSLTRSDNNESLSDDEEEQKYPISLKYMLRNHPLKNLPLQFYPHPWSACSKTCGGSGLQSRDIACEITMEKGYTLVVDETFCARKGLTKPIETRDCGFESTALTCPSWEAGPWQECTDESCYRSGFGSRKRPTYCQAFNKSRLDPSGCPQDFKPLDEEECEHENCQAMWKPSNWTKCSVSCGGRGMKSRVVECVWSSNNQSAGTTECDLIPTPETVKPCFTPVCIEPVCRDESKYCSLIPKLHMCRFPQYRRECCYSCNPSSSSSSNQPQSQAALRSRQYYVV